ncbi:hypothetical protein LSH36_65g00001 [Paralvinella palmiformis]|uniref:Cyclic nucleotide-binding domain-containing protein n=1 Tax=Paralvinella palmiformis TaxID=53620 RepID=A0AAD9NDJ8_9ANNE|nr:hypothetical protein LSH36_65g00001 [Paralvinella palmiformis]
MALVRFDDNEIQSSWTKRDKKSTRYKIPDDVEKPVIDYDKLKMLCNIKGLKDNSGNETSAEAHQEFMKKYHTVFVDPHKTKTLPKYLENMSDHKASMLSLGTGTIGNSKSVVAGESTLAHKPGSKPKPPEPELSHDIRQHLASLHKERKNEDPKAILADRIKMLRRILRKLPFERTAQEAEQVYEAVKHFDILSSQMSPQVLKELCVVAQIDSWKDADITIFGNTGLHMILKGSVRPNFHPYLKQRGMKMEFNLPTPEPQPDLPALSIGECFGTLEKVPDRDANSRILTVTTLEMNCEFLKISTSDYQRVKEQIRTRELSEKSNLMKTCKTYKMWTEQPLLKVADLFEWIQFSPNTVLASEGYMSPFIGIIKSGECHVLRQVEAWHHLSNGKKEKSTKQVVMGQLGPTDSFGEVSIIGDEPMNCSIVTSTKVELACIEPPKLKILDDVTVQLLMQSGERTFADITQDEIYEEYIEQELKRRWNEYKHNVVVEVINSKGIRPGYGKWSKQ